MEKLEVVSLIPVRGGSVRLPRKNIKMLAGKPMMNWTIEASLKSRCIDRTFVSTEDEEIKEIALKAGAEVVDRPREFAGEEGMGQLGSAIHHWWRCLWDEGYQPDIYIHLYATSPLRTARHVDEAYELYRRSKEYFLCSVCLVRGAVRAMRYIDDKTGLLESYYDCRKFRDASKYRKIYKNNGAIYIGPFGQDASGLAADLNHVIPYIMREEDSIDVDLLFEFDAAGEILKKKMNKII